MRNMAVVVVMAAMATLATVRGASAAACTGDCSGTETVSVSDIVRGVNIALGNVAVSQCSAFDGNSDGSVSISELIAAVTYALNGCGYVAPTATRTSTQGPATPTPTFTSIPTATQAVPTPTATSSIVPPGVDTTMLGTFSGRATGINQDMKDVRVRIEVVRNKVQLTDLNGNLFIASGKTVVTMEAVSPLTLNYLEAKPPRYTETLQIGTLMSGARALAGQYTTTNFSFPPQANSYAFELRRE